MVLGELDSYVQKKTKQNKEIPPPNHIIHKNKLKVDKSLKYKSQHHKSPIGEHRQENFRYPMKQYFHQYFHLEQKT